MCFAALRRPAQACATPAPACATPAPPDFSLWREFCVPAPVLRHFSRCPDRMSFGWVRERRERRRKRSQGREGGGEKLGWGEVGGKLIRPASKEDSFPLLLSVAAVCPPFSAGCLATLTSLGHILQSIHFQGFFRYSSIACEKEGKSRDNGPPFKTTSFKSLSSESEKRKGGKEAKVIPSNLFSLPSFFSRKFFSLAGAFCTGGEIILISVHLISSRKKSICCAALFDCVHPSDFFGSSGWP